MILNQLRAFLTEIFLLKENKVHLADAVESQLGPVAQLVRALGS